MSMLGPQAIRAAREAGADDYAIRGVLEVALEANRQHLVELIAEVLRFNRPEDASQVHANDRAWAVEIVRHVYGDDS